jgi:hypothetical protein
MSETMGLPSRVYVIVIPHPSMQMQAVPLTVRVEDGDALPIFASVERAEDFLSSPHMLGPGLVKEVALAQLVELLELYLSFGFAEYAVLDPPPQRWDGGHMVVDVTSAKDLSEFLKEHLA